jgi:cobalt/nickel transport system permease protein
MYIDRPETDKDRPPLSLLNRLDPRLRLAAGLVCICLAIQVRDYKILAALIAGALALLIRGGKTLLRRLIPLNTFTALLFVSLPLGELITSAVHNTEPHIAAALYKAALYGARINTAALLSMIFIIPLGISVLSGALMKLGVPPKLVTLLILSYRFIFILWERISTAVLSLRLRRPKTMPKLTELRAYAAMFAAAIISAELRSRKIAAAMKARGFDGVFPVTGDFT